MSLSRDKFDEYITRFDLAKSRADLYRNKFSQIYNMFMSGRNAYDAVDGTKEGAITNAKLYDGTGVVAARTHVSQLHTGLTPIGTKFIEIGAGSQISDPDREEFERNAQQISEILFQYVESSNFHLVIDEAYNELIISTGALVLNEGPDDNPFLFSAVPLPSFYPEEGPHGNIETVWREFNDIPFRNIKRMWPRVKIPEELVKIAKEDPNYKMNLIEGSVYEDSEDMHHHVVIHKATRSTLFEELSLSSQWIVFRGYKQASQVYGVGIGEQALPTMQSLNKIYEHSMRAMAFSAEPIFMGFSDGVFNPHQIDLVPNMIIPISPGSSPQNPPIWPVPNAGQPHLATMQIEDLRHQINALFFTQPLGPVESSVKSATEMMLRHQIDLEAKGPYVGRLQSELLDPLTKRMIYILHKKKLLPPFKIDGKEYSVTYKTPLIKSQNLGESNNIVQFGQTLQSLIGPQLSLMGFDVPNLITLLAEKMDVPLKVVKQNVEIQEVINQMQEQAQQQQEAELPQPAEGGLQQ